MAWSTPLTAVSNAVLTAAQWNASVRDNLLETAPAKATAGGKWIVSTGANTIAERTVQTVRVSAQQTTATTTFTDLTTTGPTVGPLTTGTNAIAFISALCSNSTVTAYALAGCAVTGASTIAAVDGESLEFQAATANQGFRGTAVCHFSGSLTPGLNAFVMKYRASAGTGSWGDRALTVMAM